MNIVIQRSLCFLHQLLICIIGHKGLQLLLTGLIKGLLYYNFYDQYIYALKIDLSQNGVKLWHRQWASLQACDAVSTAGAASYVMVDEIDKTADCRIMRSAVLEYLVDGGRGQVQADGAAQNAPEPKLEPVGLPIAQLQPLGQWLVFFIPGSG